MKHRNAILCGSALIIVIAIVSIATVMTEQRKWELACEQKETVWTYHARNMTLMPYTEGYAAAEIGGSIMTVTTFLDGSAEYAFAEWYTRHGNSYTSDFPPNQKMYIDVTLHTPHPIESITFFVASGPFNDVLTFRKSDLPVVPHPYLLGEPLILTLVRSGTHFRIALTVVGILTCG